MIKARLPLPLKLIALLLIGIVLGYLLLCASYLLPAEPIVKNVLASVPALNGDWGNGEEPYEQLVKGYQTTQLDNSTDAAMMLIAAHKSDEPATVRALNVYTYVSEGTTYQTFLSLGERDTKSVPISRYWHGYLVFLKPLLSVLSYMDIRVLLMLIEGAMLIGVTAGLARRGSGSNVLAFALSLICITPAITGFSLQLSTSLIVFLSAMLIVLYMPAERLSGNALPVFFMLCGMAACYFDYLTYPIATFGMPFTTVVLLMPEGSARREWKRLMICGACWALGYFGIWAGKWLLVILFGDEQWFLPNLIAKITERSSHVAGETQINYGMVLKALFGVFAKRSYLAVAIAAVPIFCFMWIRRHKQSAAESQRISWLSNRSVLLAVALLPFVWYFFTQNHSYQHAFFTARGLAVTVYALSAVIMPQTAANSKPAVREP